MQILVAMVEHAMTMEIHSAVRVLQSGLEALATLVSSKLSMDKGRSGEGLK